MDEEYDENEPNDEGGYCACGAVHSVEELDSGVCDCCGGIVE